jgi:LemA protein
MNKTALIIGGSIVGLILIIGLYLGTAYNNLVTLNESIDGGWAQVESQYQRRFDLIPNLVNAVQGSLTQEQTNFNAHAEAITR